MGKLRPVVFILAVCGASLFIVSYLNLRVLTEKDFAEQRAKQQEQIEVYNENSTLNKIDLYQQQYFNIIKKNDVLLISEKNENIKKDEKDLSDLFSEVKSNISTQNPFLNKFNDIEKKYANNTGKTTIEMNQFAKEHYEAVDSLLNEVYQAVKSTLTDTEVDALTKSEIHWLENIEDYNQHFETMDYGTIRYLVKAGYECNMRSFRTLLLMLYLN